jgi:1,4-dihydroxy-6-naphthoate synthase
LRITPVEGQLLDWIEEQGYNPVMEDILTLGFSSCPNDTFIFYALTRKKIDTAGLKFKHGVADVETLNRMAMERKLDISKVSFGALGGLLGEYCVLRSGGAIGRGCGPLVVSREELSMDDLKGRKIAIPGIHTTAFLLLRLYDQAFGENVKAMPFNEIMNAVKSGDADAGLVIHEGRFTYAENGLRKVADLGQWWEDKTGLPIPLGCVVAKRGLALGVAREVEDIIKRSALYADALSDEPMEYVKKHAQELSNEVINEHIKLYVNKYTIDMGAEGTGAAEKLIGMAVEKGLITRPEGSLFCV